MGGLSTVAKVNQGVVWLANARGRVLRLEQTWEVAIQENILGKLLLRKRP